MLRVGSWRIVRRLGENACGAVLLLQHVERARLALAKIVTGDGARSGPEYAKQVRFRFEQQRLAAMALGEDRVLPPLDLSRLPDGTPFVVLDHVDGQTLLEDLSTAGPPSINRVLQIGTRIADTLALAHERGLVHGELEPLHVLIGRQTAYRDPEVRLFEFGAVGLAGERKPGFQKGAQPVGVPGYMSPEAWAGETPTGAFDVFSLGVVLFQLLTEKLPFPLSARSFTQSMLNLLDGEVPPVDLIRSPDLEPVPAALDHVIRRALSKRASDRPTMSAIRDLLACCLVDDSLPQSTVDLAAGGLPGSGPVELLTPPRDPTPAPLRLTPAAPLPVSPEAAALLELDTAPPSRGAEPRTGTDGAPLWRRGLVTVGVAAVLASSALGIVSLTGGGLSPAPVPAAPAVLPPEVEPARPPAPVPLPTTVTVEPLPPPPAAPPPAAPPPPAPAPVVSVAPVLPTPASPSPPASRSAQRRTRHSGHAPAATAGR